MTKRDRMLLVVIAVVGVLAAAFFLVVKPKRAELRALDAQVVAAQTRLSTAQGTIAQEQSARDQLAKDMRGLLAASRAVPTTVAMPELLQQLQAAAGTSVQMTSLTASNAASPSAPTTGASTTPGAAGGSSTPGVSSQSLDLQFSGGFLSLQRFLDHLQHFVDVSRQRVTATGRLMSLDKVSLAAGKSGPGLTAQVTATIYTLNPSVLNGGAVTPAAPGTPAAPAPAGASTPTPTATAGVTK